MTGHEITPERAKQDEILRGALMRLTMQPELWMQSTYLDPVAEYDVANRPWLAQVTPQAANECGSVGCLCGWMAHDAGVITLDQNATRVVNVDLADRLGIPRWAVDENHPDYDEFCWDTVGAALAGLDRFEAAHLFSGYNSLADLWTLAAEYTNGRVSLPEELRPRVAEIDKHRQWSRHCRCALCR
jgi:hypothetical protein